MYKGKRAEIFQHLIIKYNFIINYYESTYLTEEKAKLMRRKTKRKNDDVRREKLARSYINEKIEYPIEAHNRHKFMGRSTFRNDNQTPTRAIVNRSL